MARPRKARFCAIFEGREAGGALMSDARRECSSPAGPSRRDHKPEQSRRPGHRQRQSKHEDSGPGRNRGGMTARQGTHGGGPDKRMSAIEDSIRRIGEGLGVRHIPWNVSRSRPGGPLRVAQFGRIVPGGATGERPLGRFDPHRRGRANTGSAERTARHI